MSIQRVIIRNYRALRSTDISLDPDLNILVGDNESGKSTLLEAINLALRCQLNGRHLSYELHPFLFNAITTREYIAALATEKPLQPPEILIELYLSDEDRFASLLGDNNSLKEKTPGILLRIKLDDTLQDEYREYIRTPQDVKNVPVELYHHEWFDFSGEPINPRKLPVKSALIDPTGAYGTQAANRYLLESVEKHLSPAERVSLALSYRSMKDKFVTDPRVIKVNRTLAAETGVISDKPLSVALDMTSKASWEASTIPHLADIPLSLVGKGEQSCVKVKLAIGAEESCDVLLIEEPENHLTHGNLNKLIKHMSDNATGHQLILTTHSSFVLNKLGVDHVQMFTPTSSVTLNHLTPSTRNYFKKLAGYDTLRMILSKKTILVEGPSDELVVQKAYLQRHGALPIERETEVISVGSLAFKRFLEIARALKIPTVVVTDNDGDPDAVAAKYADYQADAAIRVAFDHDASCPTLEPQILKANGREKLNRILSLQFEDDASLLKYMRGSKTEVALKLFDCDESFTVPDYIAQAVE
jgi:putative ATP-dependent endonuclease of the OLD family